MLSKRCKICKKPGDIIELFEGIYDNEMIMVCESCSEEEKIPILKKPSPNQLNLVDKRYSVRERMERMSGLADRRTQLSKDQLIVQNNINRLKSIPAKQTHDDVVENYYWELRMARRRKKMTLSQVSKHTNIPVEAIDAIEKGKIPRGFESMFATLEEFFNIKLLRHHKKKINFIVPQVDEERILDEVRKKMETRVIDEDAEYEDTDKFQKKQKLKEISDGEFNFSDTKNIDDITLSDLAELKKEKERKEKRKQLQQQTDDLLGDDIEIEWEK
jgi:ribosome-binding protein aMBF1 (putative translation factor)